LNIPLFYRCPAGNQIAIIQDALNDAPDEWTVPEKSISTDCDYCEEELNGGVCVLKWEARV